MEQRPGVCGSASAGPWPGFENIALDALLCQGEGGGRARQARPKDHRPFRSSACRPAQARREGRGEHLSLPRAITGHLGPRHPRADKAAGAEGIAYGSGDGEGAQGRPGCARRRKSLEERRVPEFGADLRGEAIKKPGIDGGGVPLAQPVVEALQRSAKIEVQAKPAPLQGNKVPPFKGLWQRAFQLFREGEEALGAPLAEPFAKTLAIGGRQRGLLEADVGEGARRAQPQPGVPKQQEI